MGLCSCNLQQSVAAPTSHAPPLPILRIATDGNITLIANLAMELAGRSMFPSLSTIIARVQQLRRGKTPQVLRDLALNGVLQNAASAVRQLAHLVLWQSVLVFALVNSTSVPLVECCKGIVAVDLVLLSFPLDDTVELGCDCLGPEKIVSVNGVWVVHYFSVRNGASILRQGATEGAGRE